MLVAKPLFLFSEKKHENATGPQVYTGWGWVKGIGGLKEDHPKNKIKKKLI